MEERFGETYNWTRMSQRTSAQATSLLRSFCWLLNSFYGGPLRGIFNILKRRHILQDVQTLILDGLSVTSDLVSDIIIQDSFNVRILSLREVQNLNDRKLQQALYYAVRPSRLANTPKLQGLYIFGPKDAPPASRFRRHVNRYPPGIAPIDTIPSYGVMSSQGAQIGAQWNQRSETTLENETTYDGDKWYQASGKVFPKPPSLEWANVMLACRGIISFDAVLCESYRHSIFELPPADATNANMNPSAPYLTARIASHTVQGCNTCHSAPEGFRRFGVSPMEQFPLLAPPPLFSSTIKSAKSPFIVSKEFAKERKLVARCLECLQSRYCESCHKWWCEQCYAVPYGDFIIPTATQPCGALGGSSGSLDKAVEKSKIKVHMGLCVEDCLVREMMSGAGSNGMWGWESIQVCQ